MFKLEKTAAKTSHDFPSSYTCLLPFSIYTHENSGFGNQEEGRNLHSSFLVLQGSQYRSLTMVSTHRAANKRNRKIGENHNLKTDHFTRQLEEHCFWKITNLIPFICKTVSHAEISKMYTRWKMETVYTDRKQDMNRKKKHISHTISEDKTTITSDTFCHETVNVQIVTVQRTLYRHLT